MQKCGTIILLMLLQAVICNAQKSSNRFRSLKIKDVDVKYYELLPAQDGSVVMSSSFLFGLAQGDELNFFQMEMNKKYGIRGLQDVFPENPKDTIRAVIYNNSGDYLFFVSGNNHIIYEDEKTKKCDLPPFYFPPNGEGGKNISSIWFDGDDDFYIGRQNDFFIVQGLTAVLKTGEYTIAAAKDSSTPIIKGEKQVKKITLPAQTAVTCFAQDKKDKHIIWIGTDSGLFTYKKTNGQLTNIFPENLKRNRGPGVTHIQPMNNGDIWFSTLEYGMGLYVAMDKSFKFYPYNKPQKGNNVLYPVKTFYEKTASEFFVAVMDSLPAIFNINSRKYKFINDAAFNESANSTTDIKVDKAGNLFLIKGGMLYTCNTFDDVELSATNTDSTAFTPFITSITTLKDEPIASIDYNPQDLNKVILPYNQASFVVYFNVNYSSRNKKIQFEWKADGYRDNWFMLPVLQNHDSSNVAYFKDLKPGRYLLRVRVKIGDGNWSNNEATVDIIITPPFWKTLWFLLLVFLFTGVVVTYIFWWRIKLIKKREKERFGYEKQILELEAKALRAQMNPHFIFNCLNSIKALTQNNEPQKATEYLTTFSKLIRTLFQNSDKRQITLYDEIETCRLYVQLEAMRLNNNLHYNFDIDPNIDLKSVMVPALIIQPFIENAIWHGIVPNGEGKVAITVKGTDDAVICEVDDNGIGREMSKLNKPVTPILHESKGVHLSQARLNLAKMLNEMNATIETVDKYENGAAAGTKIIITFNIS